MSIFSVMRDKFLSATERRGQRLARQQLLNMSHRQLEDLGISRQCLLEGISAWPWKTAQPSALAGGHLARIPTIKNVTNDVQSADNVKQAVNELSTYSDRELAERGIRRDSIEELVRNGRSDIEGGAEEQRHVA